MFDHKCEYCEGTVKEKFIKKDVVRHKDGFVLVENITIGECDNCYHKYYTGDLLKRVAEVGRGFIMPDKIEHIPVIDLSVKRLVSIDEVIKALKDNNESKLIEIKKLLIEESLSMPEIKKQAV